MGKSQAMGMFAGLLVGLSLSGCGGQTSLKSSTASDQTASVFTVGTDASLPSVVSCQVMVTGVTLDNGSTNVPVLTTPQMVDFANLSGLHQLLDLNAVPTGTYSSATVTISSPVIGFIDTSVNPPVLNTINGTLTQSSVTVNFVHPFVLMASSLVGLRMEFDLAKSIETTGGVVNGTVNPTFQMALLNASDANVSIDDFHAGVVAVTGSTTFVVQGPRGRQWTVQTRDSTLFDDPHTPTSSFTTNTIVEISGQLNPVTHDIDASEVEVVSTDNFFLGGLLTSVRPPSGPATQADLYVRAELPDITGVSDGRIETLDLNGSEQYRIANINNPITTLVFSNSSLAAGQVVDLGGALSSSGGLPTLSVHRVVLRRQGQVGAWVVGSTAVRSGNAGSFQLHDNWTAGVLLPSPLTVITTNDTSFINLSGLSALMGLQPIRIRVVGLILVDSSTRKPVMVARAVEELTN